MSPSPPETRTSLIMRLPNAADVAAWEEVVAVYGPFVYRLALRRGLQSADADDLVQEVFGAMSKSIAKWLERDDRGRFRAWLLRIARNTSVNFLTRPRHRSLGVGGEEAARALAELPMPESHANSEFDLEYRREVFRWAAEQVRDSVAESTWLAFYWSHIDSRSVKDVAQQLGISVGTVYVARSRVMSRLQELVRSFEVSE
jgi:RNA polymerase sigma-70 factor, ECF subfamily